MTSTISADLPVRDRLLLAGSHLMEDGTPGSDVSTRSICELAGVQAPTLYHHFGSKQGLLDAVVSHGFRSFLADRTRTVDERADPLDLIREGWDVHVEFGVRHRAFYSHIYGRVEPGKRCGVVSEVEAMILRTLEPAANRGHLRVPPDQAAAAILAASSGVVLTLITGDSPEHDGALSSRVRDAILGSITLSGASDDMMSAQAPRALLVSHAVGLAAALEQNSVSLGEPELALLKVWLQQLARPEQPV
jgi:AcrR family transcriptional regulator